MRILIVTDKENSAIWRMAMRVKENLLHLHIDVIAVHPKRPDVQQLQKFQELASRADIIDYQYWKTALYLLENYPEFLDKKKILQHHNPYNLFENDWKNFDKVIVNNETMRRRLKKSILIPNMIDVKKFYYDREYEGKDSKKIIMVSSRIEGKKGILPVAKVCKKLGYKFILVGSISDKDYFNEIVKEGVDFRQNISDEELISAYHESTVFVCNSIDDFESGPNPVLEAMSCGVPVLTRNVGHIPEINNSKNMLVRDGDTDNLEDLELGLKKLMENEKLRVDIRENAWITVKTRDDVRRAREYEKIYYSLLYDKELVSIIVPTYNRKETLSEIIFTIAKQDYPAIELIVCDDGSTDGTEDMIKKMQETGYPIKYINTNTPNEYNLGLARNLGVIEAIGNIIVFLDDRYLLEENCISEFVSKLYPKKWLYGDKGTGKKDFIENFSCIYRKDFINAGMFNTTIKLYGFLTQETRERFRRQGFKFEFIRDAKAKIIVKSKAKYSKKDEIRISKNMLYKMDF